MFLLFPNLRFNNNAWQEVRFSDIYEISNGINKDKESFGYGFPIVNYMDVNKNIFISKENICGKVNSSKTERKTYSVETTDILLTRTSETKEEIAYASCLTEKIDDCVFSGFLLRARPKNDQNIPMFIAYLLRSNKYRKELMKLSTMTSRALINSDNLGRLQIRIPDQSTQIKISKTLKLIDQQINTQSKIIEDLETLKNKINDTLIYQQGYNKTIPLYELSTLKNGYAFKSSSYTESADFKIITIGNVTGAKFCDTKECNKIQYISKDIQSHQKLKKNDILISLTGNVGRVSLCNEDNCLLNQRVGVLELNSDANREFIYQCLSNKKFEQAMISKGQGAAQLNIGKSDIESFEIPLFDNKYQEYISSVLSFYDTKIQKEKDMLDLYKKQKAYLLQNMFI